MTLNWRWPQYVVAVWLLLGLITGIGTHGKKDYYDFSGGLITMIIFSVILVFGGFFRTIGWAQVVWLALTVVSLGVSMRSDGESYTKSFGSTVIGLALNAGLLALGGFFS